MSTHNIDPAKLRRARQWAEEAKKGLAMTTNQITHPADTAAEVITALPDTIVDGDELREVINRQLSSHQHGTVGHHVAEELACKLQFLLPDPKPPTLADMTPEEREAYRFMQSIWHSEMGDIQGVLFWVEDEDCMMLFPDGEYASPELWEVTPLPDLPHLEWPAAEPLDPTEQQNLDDMQVDEPQPVTYDAGGPFPISRIGFHLLGSEADGETVSESEKVAHAQTEPQPGEAWLIGVAGRKRESVKLDNSNLSWLTVDDTGTMVCYMNSEITPLARLVPDREVGE